MAGHEQNRPQWDTCRCGKPAFKKESDATKYMLNKRRVSEPVDVVRCPVGDSFHVFNPGIREKNDYIRYLTETAGQPARPKVREPADLGSGSSPPVSHPTRPTCTKLGYGTERLATVALKQAQEAGRSEKRAYQCPSCGRWHLSSLEEFFPAESITYEELLGCVQLGEQITVSVGRYPNGTIANLMFSGPRGGSFRIFAEHLTPLRLVLESLDDRQQEQDDATPPNGLNGTAEVPS